MNRWRELWQRAREVNPLVVDTALALVLFAVSVTETATEADCPCVSTSDISWTVLFLAIMTLPLALRRRYPFTVMNVVGAAAIVFDLLGIPPDPFTAVFPLVVAVYTTSVHARRDRAIVTGVILLVALIVLNLPFNAESFKSTATSFFLLGGAWIVGDNIRQRHRKAELLEERAERAEREREERAGMAAMEERNRIAREIHDVIAHSVSVVAVQAGAARAVVQQQPERAVEALQSIERVSHDAMAELRRLIAVLRVPADAASLVPQPGLDRLDELVEAVRTAGLDVELHEEGTRPSLPAGLDLSAYRVVQEALTNTLRHANARSARVRVRYADDELDIEVQDDGRGGTDRPAVGDGGGHGLVGMRERVTMFGGTFQAGATGAGFTVRARFPLPAGGGPG